MLTLFIDFMQIKKWSCREFPGCPVVRTWCFHCCGPGSIPGRGTKIPQATQCGQKKKKKDHAKDNNSLYLISVKSFCSLISCVEKKVLNRMKGDLSMTAKPSHISVLEATAANISLIWIQRHSHQSCWQKAKQHCFYPEQPSIWLVTIKPCDTFCWKYITLKPHAGKTNKSVSVAFSFLIATLLLSNCSSDLDL